MDELRGDQATWRFDGESVSIRYHTGWFKDHLLKALGRCEVPVSAIASVDFRAKAARKKGWTMRLHLRERADPYAAVGAMLSEGSQPFRLTGPAKTELLAEYCADQIAFAAQQAAESGVGMRPDEATRFVPRLPAHIQTSEGTAAFDGSTVRLVWSGSEASSRKRKAQRREFPFTEVTGVEWVPSDGWEYGYLRVVTSDAAPRTEAKPKNDLSCLLCDEGEEGAGALLMAATVTAHLWARDGGGPPRPELGARPGQEIEAGDGPDSDTGWIYDQIRRLGDLHAEGILTDEEFAAKKAELLDRL